jgi:hypothetical protein
MKGLFFITLVVGSIGCYQSYSDGDDDGRTTDCFSDAIVVSLDRLGSGPGDVDSCRTIEVTGTSDDCNESRARVAVILDVGRPSCVSGRAEVIAAPDGARVAGRRSPGPTCEPCGSGVIFDTAPVGHLDLWDACSGSGTAKHEYTFLGRDVRYRITFCAGPGVGPGR